MKPTVFILLFLLLANIAKANVSDKLMTKVLSQQIPNVLHQQQNQPFQLGTYDITVFKAGSPMLQSTANSWQLKQPIRVEFLAKVSQTVLGTTMAFDCATEFTSQSLWLITPNISQNTAKITIDMPIPETKLQCDGLTLPITTVLQQWFNSEKTSWQQQAQQQYHQAMKKVF